jgi:hypothetical protein
MSQYQSYPELATAILQWGKHAIKEEFCLQLGIYVVNMCREKRSIDEQDPCALFKK